MVLVKLNHKPLDILQGGTDKRQEGSQPLNLNHRRRCDLTLNSFYGVLGQFILYFTENLRFSFINKVLVGKILPTKMFAQLIY